MPKFIFIFLFVSCLAATAIAQELPCATQLSAKQWDDLRNFQQKLSTQQAGFQNKSTQYVPLKIHIIGNNQGIGYYSISNLMQALCEINQRFAPVGFHFYLAQTVNYINDDALNLGNLDAIYDRAFDYKMPNAVNVFFHNGGNQWCGVYIPDVDVIFVKNSCQAPNATTLAHELGHFFNLPHTFYGWEGGTSFLEIEKIDGSNCRTAGDGFCDTKADYVSSRWSCPLPYTLTDPNNIVFKPDSSMYMSYSLDACQSRFSQEQMQAMRNNLQMRGIAKTTAEVALLPAPTKISPANSDSAVLNIGVPFVWNAVPGAFAYHLQIARFGDWNNLNYSRLITDTSVQINLFGNWPFAWRIKAITEGNTCSSFGSADTFFTRELPAGLPLSFGLSEPNLFPNPVRPGTVLSIQGAGGGSMQVFDVKGNLMWEQGLQNNSSFNVPNWPAGCYILKWQSETGILIKRLLISEN